MLQLWRHFLPPSKSLGGSSQTVYCFIVASHANLKILEVPGLKPRRPPTSAWQPPSQKGTGVGLVLVSIHKWKSKAQLSVGRKLEDTINRELIRLLSENLQSLDVMVFNRMSRMIDKGLEIGLTFSIQLLTLKILSLLKSEQSHLSDSCLYGRTNQSHGFSWSQVETWTRFSEMKVKTLCMTLNVRQSQTVQLCNFVCALRSCPSAVIVQCLC